MAFDCVLVDEQRVATLLETHDNFLVLTHKSPDGDTLGLAAALCRLLQNMGKHARLENSEEIPAKYDFLFEGLPYQDFTPEYIVAVDVADPELLGDKLSQYADQVDLCIDHHPSNKRYAKELLLREDDGAASLTFFRVIKAMHADITKEMATDLYTGISTDTGCFRYANATAETYRVAAELIELGANNADVNVRMFETKSLSYFCLLQEVLADLRMYCEGQVAVFKVSRDMMDAVGATDHMLDAIAPMSRQIEGVKAGVTMKQTQDGRYKFSLRTHEPLDASEICGLLGGGGHARAAGTGMLEDEEAALRTILEFIAEKLDCEVE